MKSIIIALFIKIILCENLPNEPPLEINKCCGLNETMIETNKEPARCILLNNNTTKISWSPIFTSEDGLKTNIQVKGGFNIIPSTLPNCGTRQQWPIYHYKNSTDKLVLLTSGWLRHVIIHSKYEERYYDYEPRKFCMERVKFSNGDEAQFAVVCNIETIDDATELRFLIKFIINPVFHGLCMILLLITSITYFILPQLRDLLGNMVTTITLLLVLVYAADLVRIFREFFTEHISFLAADIVLQIGLLAIFFWLNGMGYYIWKTFRSRNVFLRVTDKRKYCYYSCYAWGCTFCFAALALFAHFVLDADVIKQRKVPTNKRTLGYLGLAMFFTPIAFTILVNIFFYLTTAQAISRMSTYGRIHHKMKYNFEMFLKLFLVLGATWLCLLMSWMDHYVADYIYIVAMSLQGFLIFYICFCQRRVLFLLRRTFCSETCFLACCRPPTDTTGEEGEWGEEMLSMTPR